MTKNQIYKYIACDIIASIIIWTIFFLFRRIANDFNLIEVVTTHYFVPSYQLWLSAIFFPILSILIHYLTGFYNVNQSKSRLVELFVSITSALLITIISFFVILIDDQVISYLFYYKSLLVLFSLQFVITYSFRFIITNLYFKQYRTGKKSVPLLIIGAGESAAKITNNVACSKHFIGRKLIGYISIRPNHSINNSLIIGDCSSITKIVQQHNIKEVIIAVDEMDDSLVFSIMNKLLKHNIHVLFAPRLYEIITGNVLLGDIHSEPLVSVTHIKMPAWQQSTKRAFDITISAIVMLTLAPLYFYLMQRVKFDSSGPIFYTQKRVGYKQREFNIYKFRTMISNAENGTPKLTDMNDSRITPFGKTMRKYRLDELPQFWNIIKGDMSIVGPRPERRFFIDEIEKQAPYYSLILNIRPGLLSWGPIKVGYADSIEKMIDRLKYDIVYMDNMSLITDLKIMLYSIEVIFNGKGQ